MSAISFSDAVMRVSQLQAQLSSLQSAFVPSAAQSAASSGTTAAAGSGAAVTQVPQTSSTLGADATTDFASQLGAALGTPASSASAATSDAALPSSATARLTSGQRQFASQLASDTGLDPTVVSAWLLAEESGSAAVARQSVGNNDWLNIGYTDSATYGSGDSVWSNPVTAANATAGWLDGKDTIPGYGTASAGIQAILGTAGSSPTQQISALQGSGWASSGYPDLPSLYSQLAA